ncbi:MAG: succinylglutamate desuccinylase/aspartoacylase family protein [Saprospiraceae bacterium]|nr:succinylglutamate desuccinylase/aspartoacylase family protein [Saprospiraceae bacterium]
MVVKRIIGSYTGEEKGPLFITLGGTHGNETAGVKALDLVLKMLEVEPITNPNFTFRGQFLALTGNLAALAQEVRFVDKDLNRQFTHTNIERIKNDPIDKLDTEDKELKALISTIEFAINEYDPEKVILLDLHTTSSDGGIFTITSDDEDSIRLGQELHAPVVLGFIRGIGGTTLHYFNSENIGRKVIALSFEAGQHNDPLSVNRSIAAIINVMRSVGCVREEDVENRHIHLLEEYGKNLPTIVELQHVHHIDESKNFVMNPGFSNFQPIKKGQPMAIEDGNIVPAEMDGLILMPLYQHKGSDGYFIVKVIEE